MRSFRRLPLPRPEPQAEDGLRVRPEREEPVVDEKRVDEGPRRRSAGSGDDESRGEGRDR
jgi:hypothetical protein